jgi:hypothetical protein
MKVIIDGQEYWTRSEYYRLIDLRGVHPFPKPDVLQLRGDPKSVDGKRHALYLPNRPDILAFDRTGEPKEVILDHHRPLGDLYGQRRRFTGTFVRQGRKRAYKGYGTEGDGYDATVLFQGVMDESGRIVADHLWFNLTEGFVGAGMAGGDLVSFDARVDDYLKGYEKDSYDYKLLRPTKIVNYGQPKE